MRRGDIFTAEGGLLVLFKWTNTIQCNECRLLLPLVPIKGGPLCPVAMFQRMCELVPAPSNVPAFIFDFSRKGGYLSVSGAASFAFNCGVPGELIQVFGD